MNVLVWFSIVIYMSHVGMIQTSGGVVLYHVMILDTYKPKLNHTYNFWCKFPIPNFIENRSVVLEIKHWKLQIRVPH